MNDTIPTWAIRTKADERAIAEGCYWSQKHADKVVNFTNKWFKTQFSTTFKLTAPQSRIQQQLYAWRLPDGRKRWWTATLHTCKKSFGKTMLAAAICFFELFGSGEPSSFVCSAAASIANSAQIFEEVRYSVERSPFKDFSKIKRHTKEIEVADLNARYRSPASDDKRYHGFNCSLCVIDECHAVPADLWHSLRYSTSARPSGLVLAISTSGSDQSHWYFQLYQKSKRVMLGEDTDITHFAQVHEAEATGNPEDPKQWRLANPLLGSPWCPEDQFARDLEAAKTAGVGEWLNFLRLRLNLWVRPDEVAYFDVSKIDTFTSTFPEDQLAKLPAAVGVDLSEVGDPSSISLAVDLNDGKVFVLSWAWVAER